MAAGGIFSSPRLQCHQAEGRAQMHSFLAMVDFRPLWRKLSSVVLGFGWEFCLQLTSHPLPAFGFHRQFHFALGAMLVLIRVHLTDLSFEFSLLGEEPWRPHYTQIMVRVSNCAPPFMRRVLFLLGMMISATSSLFTQPNVPLFKPDSRILFQGDSITDGGRGRNGHPNHVLGHSYAYLIAARYGADFPERKLVFFNRGVSGNKVPQLAERWQKDTIDLKPTVVSILIGVNDIWHPLNDGKDVSAEEFEAGYDKLLATTVAALPGVKLVLGEPFILPGKATSPKWDEWQPHLRKFQAIVEKLAVKYHAPVVHYQKLFDNAVKRAPAEYWIWDGVHPTYAGHQLMADEWIRTVNVTWPKGD